MTSLPALDAIAGRRATRTFDPGRPVGPEILAEILRAAALAPSAFNLQPSRFLVVRSPRNRARLMACAFGQPKVGEAPVVVIVLGYLSPHIADLDDIIGDMKARGLLDDDGAAAYRGRVAGSMAKRADPTLWATRSAMLAAGTLMIAAESLGVNSAPMEGFDAEEVRSAFGVPDDHAICCLVALGHAAEVKPFPGRLPLERICFEEHFGQPWTG